MDILIFLAFSTLNVFISHRVGNMRASSLVEAHVRAILISKKVTLEGEVMPYSQTELTIGTDNDGEEDELFFIWPTTLIHKINSDSPFYEMSAKDFLKKRFEIVVILEGVVEQTGNSIQVQKYKKIKYHHITRMVSATYTEPNKMKVTI